MNYTVVIKSEIERWLYLNTATPAADAVADVIIKLDAGTSEEAWTYVIAAFLPKVINPKNLFIPPTMT